MKNIKVAIVKEQAMEVVFDTIKDDLDVFYSLIDCDTIDIVTRRIGGQEYDIICDDEALLREFPTITFLSLQGSEMSIYGGIIIAGVHDPDREDLASLTEEDCENIRNHIMRVSQTYPLGTVTSLVVYDAM